MGLDVGLSSVDEELGVVRAESDGLAIEAHGELEVIVDERFFGLLLEIGRHDRRGNALVLEREREESGRERLQKFENWEEKDLD